MTSEWLAILACRRCGRCRGSAARLIDESGFVAFVRLDAAPGELQPRSALDEQETPGFAETGTLLAQQRRSEFSSSRFHCRLGRRAPRLQDGARNGDHDLDFVNDDRERNNAHSVETPAIRGASVGVVDAQGYRVQFVGCSHCRQSAVALCSVTGGFHYSQDRFANALRALERPLTNRPDTPNARLRVAIVEVYACGRHDFARKQDYDEFTALMADLRARSTDGYIIDMIRRLPQQDCADFTARFMALAKSVVTAFVLVALPAEPVPHVDSTSTPAIRRA